MTAENPGDLPPFYYLHNFTQVLNWVGQRYPDLLSPEEKQFRVAFQACPEPSQALLVRMVMRKGQSFRASKLSYVEIGETPAAAKPLISEGWLTDNPTLTLPQVAALLTRKELLAHFAPFLPPRPTGRKADLVTALVEQFPEPRPWHAWLPTITDALYQLNIMDLSDRFRLMFFGNLRQEWSTFVLAELGLFQYETVALTDDARPFQHRHEVTTYLQLQACRDAFEQGEDIDTVLANVPAPVPENTWLTQRRDRLLYQLAYAVEREQNLPLALSLYTQSGHPGARLRRLRILEKQGEYAAGLALLQEAAKAPENEAERQQIARIQPRLHRKLGLPKPDQPANTAIHERTLTLPNDGRKVEPQVRDHLTTDAAPVFYVENTLINGLLGLLCWPVVFAGLPQAFFNPYQSGPADLYRPEFYQRRQHRFTQALAELDSGEYANTIRRHHREKFGLQSPFVHWGILPEPVLELALQCLPPRHLKVMFERILFDVKANRSGLPDLIQFFPETAEPEARYRMLEVKAPGDRLQDNQRRWLTFCARHHIPIDVVHVIWESP